VSDVASPANVIRFGTDGWRAIIAEDFTFENVRLAAQAASTYYRRQGDHERGVVVGYDTRFLSERFAAAAAEVVAANGIPVYLCSSPAPTPVIGYSILDRGAAGSIVITSSHNPAEWSGFKVRTDYAGAASPEAVTEIESYLGDAAAALSRQSGSNGARIEEIDPKRPYLRHLSELVDLDALRAAGLRVVVDPMYGAGAGYLRELLSGGSTEVSEIRADRNPAFPGMHNPEPIPRNLEATREAITRHQASVALATDGDADRIGVMDGNGRFVNQLETFALLAYYLLEVRGLRGPIIKSVTTTSMVLRLGELYDVPVHETGVGFKFLGPKMRETDALIAGEESGGFAFRGHMPERDGVLSGLYILDLMARRGKDLPALISELFDRVGPHYYDRIDITMTEDARNRVRDTIGTLAPKEIAGLPVTGVDRTDGLRFLMEDGAWALIRLSGTEPLMRIYCEVRDEAQVQPVLQAVKEMTGA
jgi:phosphomannomutase